MSARPYTEHDLRLLRESSAAAEKCRPRSIAGSSDLARWIATLDAERAVSDRLREALKGLVRDVDDLDAENGDRNLFVRSGCVLCTDFTTPNVLNAGLCAYHKAEAMLKEVSGEGA